MPAVNTQRFRQNKKGTKWETFLIPAVLGKSSQNVHTSNEHNRVATSQANHKYLHLYSECDVKLMEFFGCLGEKGSVKVDYH